MRSTRMSRCSSPMPAMIVWPVSSSVCTWNVGSSSARRWIAAPSLSGSFFVADLVTDGVADVERARQIVGDRVEHGLHALVLERATAQHRVELAGDGGPTDAGHHLLGRGRDTVEVLLHQLVVLLGQRLDQ